MGWTCLKDYRTALDQLTNEATETELQVLLLLGEARGEGTTWQEWAMILSTVWTRVSDHRWPGNAKEVILQPKQFSCFMNNRDFRFLWDMWWNHTDNCSNLLLTSDKFGTRDGIMYSMASQLVKLVNSARELGDTRFMALPRVTNYLASYLYESDNRPSWAASDKVVGQYGNTIFFCI